jgi:hypothetical protein
MQFLQYNRISGPSVKKGTGKDWKEWVSILEKSGARGLTHKEIVAFLKKRYKLTPWWQQSVTLGFEIHIGRRVEGRNERGEHALTATKSLPVPQKDVWKFLNSEKGVRVWLQPMSDFELKKGMSFEREGGIFGEVRTCKAPLRARIAWQDIEWLKPSILQIYVVPRPKGKSILVFNHEKIMKARDRDELRAHWKNVLNRIHELFI